MKCHSYRKSTTIDAFERKKICICHNPGYHIFSSLIFRSTKHYLINIKTIDNATMVPRIEPVHSKKAS